MGTDSFDVATYQWQQGERRVREADPGRRMVLERVVDRTVAELRRRLGGPFRTDELVRLYDEQGTAWVMDIAASVAPEEPWAWDQRVADAAFGRYLREASDFAGGRRLGD